MNGTIDSDENHFFDTIEDETRPAITIELDTTENLNTISLMFRDLTVIASQCSYNPELTNSEHINCIKFLNTQFNNFLTRFNKFEINIESDGDLNHEMKSTINALNLSLKALLRHYLDDNQYTELLLQEKLANSELTGIDLITEAAKLKREIVQKLKYTPIIDHENIPHEFTKAKNAIGTIFDYVGEIHVRMEYGLDSYTLIYNLPKMKRSIGLLVNELRMAGVIDFKLKNIITIDLDSDIQKYEIAGGFKFGTSIIELVTNAIKSSVSKALYSLESENLHPEIYVTAKITEYEGQEYLLFNVIDNGIGFANSKNGYHPLIPSTKHGLKSIEEMVEKYKYILSTQDWSSDDQNGAEVTLLVPITKKHLTP